MLSKPRHNYCLAALHIDTMSRLLFLSSTITNAQHYFLSFPYFLKFSFLTDIAAACPTLIDAITGLGNACCINIFASLGYKASQCAFWNVNLTANWCFTNSTTKMSPPMQSCPTPGLSTTKRKSAIRISKLASAEARLAIRR